MYKESIRSAVRLQNSSPTRKTYRLLFARRRAKVFQKRDEVGEMFSDDASGKRERETERDRETKRKRKRTNHPKRGKNTNPAPLRQLFHVCHGRDDFDVRCGPVLARDEGFEYFSHVCSCAYLIRVILCGFLSILKAIFPQHLGFQLMIQNPKQERSRFFRIQKLARSRVFFK